LRKAAPFLEDDEWRGVVCGLLLRRVAPHFLLQFRI
jgi:hypothetical protein